MTDHKHHHHPFKNRGDRSRNTTMEEVTRESISELIIKSEKQDQDQISGIFQKNNDVKIIVSFIQ